MDISAILMGLKGESGGLFASGLFVGFIAGCTFYQKYVGTKDAESITKLEARTQTLEKMLFNRREDD